MIGIYYTTHTKSMGTKLEIKNKLSQHKIENKYKK